MLKRVHPSLDFKKLSIPAKVMFAENVESQLSNHSAEFPNPDVSALLFNQKVSALSLAAQQASGGDHQKIVAMHAAEKELDSVLETQAKYVDRIANGDENIIALSGFHSTVGQSAPAAIPGAVTGTKITVSQQPGSIHVECDVMHGVSGFIYFVSTTTNAIVFNNSQFQLQNNAGVIAMTVDTHRKIDFTGLPSGQNFFLFVVAFNPTGMGAVNAAMSFRTL